MKTGVYIIKCLVNGRVYVGGSRNVTNRFAVHRFRLRRNGHHAHGLQQDWDAFGEGKFTFELIEKCSVGDLLVREQVALDEAFSSGAPYNSGRVAGSPRGFVHGPQMRRRMSEAHAGRKQTPEHRAARSVALKGRRPSEATLAASVAYHSGRKHSEAERERQSAGLRRAWADGKFAGRGSS